MTKETRGGDGRGQGRKPLSDDERTVVTTVRLTPARKEKLRRLGSHWLSKAINRARNTEKPQPTNEAAGGASDVVRGVAGITVVTGVEDFVITPFEQEVKS